MGLSDNQVEYYKFHKLTTVKKALQLVEAEKKTNTFCFAVAFCDDFIKTDLQSLIFQEFTCTILHIKL